MNWLKTIFGAVTQGEGLVKQVGDVVDRFVQTKEEKAAISLEIQKIAHKQEMELAEAANKADSEFNNRIKDLEGTAKDLMQAGWLGRVVLFARGAQRPAWGWGVLFFDLQYFRGAIQLGNDGEALLYAINLLVLGFLFGERAIKNVAPMLKDVVRSRKAKN